MTKAQFYLLVATATAVQRLAARSGSNRDVIDNLSRCLTDVYDELNDPEEFDPDQPFRKAG